MNLSDRLTSEQLATESICAERDRLERAHSKTLNAAAELIEARDWHEGDVDDLIEALNEHRVTSRALNAHRVKHRIDYDAIADAEWERRPRAPLPEVPANGMLAKAQAGGVR